MIRFTLKCPLDHSFDSWFQSDAAFGQLLATGHVACPVCGSGQVEKSLMAPAVRPARKAGAERAALSEPGSAMEQALAGMRRQIEANSEYVGMNFVAEARAIHEGDAPERSIYGEARLDEARRLVEDGVPVAALPFMPVRKVN